MTAPGGVIATVYVEVLPKIQSFAKQLRQDLRQSSRELRQIDRELTPVTRGFQTLGKTATGIVPGIRLTRTSLVALGAQSVVGGIVAAAGAVTTLSGALGVLPAVGVAAASVMGTLSIGLDGVSDALEKFRDPEKFATKLKLLSDNAQATLGVLNEFRTEIFGFRDAVQDQLFAGLDEVGRGLVTTFLPRATTHFTNLASVINLGAKDLANFVQTGTTLADIDEVTANVETGFTGLRAALIPAATAFRDIVTVGSRFLPLIANELTGVVTRFSEWIQVMRNTGQLQSFFASGIRALEQVFRILGNVGGAIGGVLSAARQSGNGLLDTLERLTGSLENFIKSARGQSEIKSFLDSARGAAQALTPVLVSLVELLFNHVFPVLESFARAVGPAVAKFFSELGAAIDTAAPGIETFATGFGLFINAITPALPLIGQLIGQIGLIVGALSAKLGPVILEVATAIGNVLVPILNVLGAIFIVISPDILKFIVVIGVVIASITALINVVRGFQAIAGLFAGAFAQLASGIGKTEGAARGFIGFLSGPWGIVIGAAAVALGLFLSKSDDTSSAVNGLANAMSNATGSVEAATREFIRNDLEAQGIAATAAKAGIGINDLIGAYEGLPGAQERVITQLARSAEAGKISFDEFEALLNILKQGPEVYDRATEAAERKRQADEESANSLQILTGLYNSATDAINQTNDAVTRQNNLQLESLNSELAYQNQLARTQAELSNGALTLDIYTQEGRDNLSSLTELVRVGDQHVADLKAQNASTQEVNATIEANRNQLIAMVQPFFTSRAAAEQYLQTLGLIPKSISTQVILNISSVLAAAQQAAAIIRNIPGQIFGGGRARGGPVRAGDWTLVGEDGPELVRFGRSARVFSTDESERMASDVGTLDSMTTRGGAAGSGGTASTATAASGTSQITNQISVTPTVKVYIDGQEFRGMVQVEMNDRDRQLQRLITTNAGGRR